MLAPLSTRFVYVTVYSPDCSGLKSSAGSVPVTPGHGSTPSGQSTVHTSEPATASALKALVPALRFTLAKGDAWSGRHRASLFI
jgi:hypothetical protein